MSVQRRTQIVRPSTGRPDTVFDNPTWLWRRKSPLPRVLPIHSEYSRGAVPASHVKVTLLPGRRDPPGVSSRAGLMVAVVVTIHQTPLLASSVDPFARTARTCQYAVPGPMGKGIDALVVAP